MSGFCLAATVGHAGLLRWLAQRLHVRRDVYHFTNKHDSCERTEEQESRVTAGSRPRCGAYGLLTVIQLQVRETTSRGTSGARLQLYSQGDQTRKAIPCSPREQRRADQDLWSRSGLRPGDNLVCKEVQEDSDEET